MHFQTFQAYIKEGLYIEGVLQALIVQANEIKKVIDELNTLGKIIEYCISIRVPCYFCDIL